jgi:hypothetical protein
MPKSRSRKKAPTLPGIGAIEHPGQVWFSRNGCVVRKNGRMDVYVDRVHFAGFEECDTDIRNLTLVLLAKNGGVVLEKLAEAFGISSETLRQIRRLHENEGIEAVVARIRRGRKSVVTAALRRRAQALFDQGLTIDEVHGRIRKKVSRATVGSIRQQWARSKADATEPEQQTLTIRDFPGDSTEAARPKPPEEEEGVLPELPVTAVAPAAEPSEVAAEAIAMPPEPKQAEPQQEGAAGSIRAPGTQSPRELRAPKSAEGSPEKDRSDDFKALAGEPVSRRGVQYLGAWLLVAMVAETGLYERMKALLPASSSAHSLRVALDSVLIPLALGQKCVEGVRRLATRSAAALLLTMSAPSPNWVRQTLGKYCRGGAAEAVHFQYAGDMIRAYAEEMNRAAAASGESKRPVTFFADNHHRPYTGKHRVLHGWRMQDKRPRPGTTDYYVHDCRGVPMFRGNIPTHGSLSQFLVPIAILLRIALGAEARLLVGYDRGASFPDVMAAIRMAENLEFVTYERAPWRKLPRALFKEKGKAIEIEGDREGEYETLYFIEDLCNLGDGRGRVRRLRVLTPNGKQISVLAKSEEDGEWLIRTMFSRWWQENGLKHGVERWGANQLDGRKVEPYEPDTVIFNPEKRRLKRKIDKLRENEGKVRRKLARVKNDSRRAALEAELAKTLKGEARHEARYARLSDHLPVKEAGTKDLVHHCDEYKMLIDTLRIAGSNAEAQLARWLAPHMNRPREAKRAVQNLFNASGNISVRQDVILVSLDPAGTANERRAFDRLFAIVNQKRLTHPGDPKRRPLQFRTQGR